MFTVFTIFLLLIVNVHSFKINFFDPVIGKWNLLYCDNPVLNLEKNKCELNISPEKIDKLCVKITKSENVGFIRFSKTINSNAYYSACELFDEDNIPKSPKNSFSNRINKDLGKDDSNNFTLDDGEYCSLVILTARKSISSIGIFEFPYFASNYKSEMRTKYLISWRVDNLLNRLYIYLDKKTYIFERSYCSSKKNNGEDSITTNAFLLTNIISFLLGKLLEKTVHF
jgi:hypothetical protein